VSIPTTVTYLDNRYVYVGSHLGDSQLVHIDSEPGFNGEMISIVESYPNLAPITDMCTVEQGRQIQECVITCSGGYEHGALKIIRNGIGFTQQALLDLPDITGIWSIGSGEHEGWEETMVLSFMNETRILKIDEDEEMAELDVLGNYELNEPTLYTGNMHGQLVVQITPTRVQLLSLADGLCVSTWTPTAISTGNADEDTAARITIACGNREQIVVALSGGIICYLVLNGQSLEEKGLEQTSVSMADRAHLLAIGLWTDNSLLIYKLSTWQQVAYERLSAGITPRSVLLVRLEDRHYAMVGMAAVN
ncbi:mono-functional DNA-alkylating methyl methanesulfonate N-term-domain-containing protein, partial [Syncephalis pseudoplumigaleata]